MKRKRKRNLISNFCTFADGLPVGPTTTTTAADAVAQNYKKTKPKFIIL